MKNFLLFLFIAIASFLMAQVPQANSLVQLHAVSTAGINSISRVVEGSLIFDSDEQAVYTYSSSNGWIRIQQEANTYLGSFILYAASGSISITNITFKPAKVTFEAQIGNELGQIFGQLTSFDTNGFTILAGTIVGTVTVNSSNHRLNVQASDLQNESIVVLYTAHK